MDKGMVANAVPVNATRSKENTVTDTTPKRKKTRFDFHKMKPGMPLLSNVLDAVHESSGVGTIFPNGAGEPVLHLHIACGRDRSATLGCARDGVVVWQYMEVIVLEIVGTDARRLLDKKTGFTLLNP